MSITYEEINVTALGRRIRVFSRHEFLTKRWVYKAGQHLAFIAPTQDGKTTLAFQLLKYLRTGLSPRVLVMKPRDPTPAAWGRHLGFKETPVWPPVYGWNEDKKPPGFMVWPLHIPRDTKATNANMAIQFEACLEDSYATGDCVVFADEVFGLVHELPGDLLTPLTAIWARGGGMGVGLWAATQKPTGDQGKGVPGYMYSNSTHLFLSKDPDARSRKRYGEIGGVDPKLVEALVMMLQPYQFVYIKKRDEIGGPYICIIDAK